MDFAFANRLLNAFYSSRDVSLRRRIAQVLLLRYQCRVW